MADKKHKLIVSIGAMLVFGLIFVLGKGLEKSGTQIPSALIGKPATDFEALWIQGQDALDSAPEKLSLAAFKGKPVVLNFWASWCYSCRQEARDLEQAWQLLRDQGVVVLGIAIQDEIETARSFAKQYGKTYPLALDETGKISMDYGVTGVPETFFINASGEIVEKIAAPVELATIMQAVERMKL